MVWRPRGVIAVREAVLRLSQILTPQVDVRAYVAKPWPSDPETNVEPWDPYQRPRHTEADPEWRTLEAARSKVEQAAGDGILVISFRSPNTENPVEIPATSWRPLTIGGSLRNERTHHRRDWQDYRSEWDFLGYLVQEHDFTVWMSKQRPPETVAETHDDEHHVRWATEYAENALREGRRAKYQAAIDDISRERRVSKRKASDIWGQVPEHLRNKRGQKR